MHAIVATALKQRILTIILGVVSAIGSQVQRPLAIVVVGGTLLAPFLFLTVLPAAIGVFLRRRPRGTVSPAAVTATTTTDVAEVPR